MGPSDLQAWPILHMISDNLLKELKTVFVYGESANSALIITQDDNVYAVGSNTSGRLGTGDTSSKIQPQKIYVLCQKQIINFAAGSVHVIALTKDGYIYSWGGNSSHQLGNQGQYDNSLPALVLLNEGLIDQVLCSNHRSVALTKNGQVYCWGNVDGINLYNVPKLINTPNGSIKQVACSQTAIYGLNYSGRLFCLKNCYHQSVDTNQISFSSMKIARSVEVEKIACGYSHLLILTNSGDLYACGTNDAGQLGTNKNPSSSETLVKVNQEEMGKVSDIGAINCGHISVAVANHERIFVWGLCRGIPIFHPALTPFKNIHEALGFYGTPGIMHEALTLTANCGDQTVINDLKKAFDDQSSSDLKIQIEERSIHVHKAILKIRSKYFNSMFQDCWKENNQKVIVQDHFSYEAYICYLKFLYTNEVELPPEEHFDDLLNLANEYCETLLKKKCAESMHSHITVQNVLLLYKAAVDYNCQELKDLSLRFALKNMTATVKETSFSSVDEATLKLFFVEAAESRAFKT